MKAIKCKSDLYLKKMQSGYNVNRFSKGLPRMFVTTRDEIKGDIGDIFCVLGQKEQFKLVDLCCIDAHKLQSYLYTKDIYSFVSECFWFVEGFSSKFEMESVIKEIYPKVDCLYTHIMEEV